jgi:polysaccharide deacetylase 2 family uncharacterized protein YibQ
MIVFQLCLLLLLFGCLQFETAAVSENNKSIQSESVPKLKARVAIIIDDVGFLHEPAMELLKIPARLTWSVLPFGPFSQELALAGHKRGFEVMLHLPMASFRGKINPGPGVIDRNWQPEKMLQQLDADLKAVPGATGINNHMGSPGHIDRVLMTVLMQEISRRHLFYVDSITDFSVAGYYAKLYRVSYAKRDVFIDHYRELTANEASLRQLIQIALKNGSAIGIGHTREGTATEITAMLPEFAKAGVEIVPVSELVKD